MYRMRLTILLTFWLAAPLHAASVLEECPIDRLDIAAFAPVEGELKTDLSTAKEQVYLLAKGYMGEPIRRHVPASGAPAYITKTYRVELKYLTEKAGYEFAETLRDPKAVEPTFRIPSVRTGADPMALQLEDTQGRAFLDVMQDSRVPEGIRNAIAGRYESYLKEFKRRATAKTTQDVPTELGEYKGHPSWHPSLRSKDGKNITLNISARQVLVTFTPGNPREFELSLIDTY